jgi:DNA polymerase-4
MQIREIFTEHTLLIEPLALDEAYLDVTQNIKGIPTATKIAREIRTSIRERVGLNASAGVSYNKFLAKLASDHGKPDGLYVITPEMGPSFVEGIAIEKFHGVGPVTAARMHACGIFNGLDLRGKSLRFLQEKFGKSGPYFHGIANGIDSRPVRTDRVRKSVGAENTFTHNLREPEDLRNELLDVIGKTWSRIERTGVNGRTVTLKLKYADFHQITRSRSSNDDIAGRDELEIVALDLLNGLLPMPLDVRLLGVTVSSLDNERADESKQLRLF